MEMSRWASHNSQPLMARHTTASVRPTTRFWELWAMCAGHLPPLRLVGEHERPRRREHAAHAVHQRDLAVRHLTRAALAAELPRGLDDRKDPVHAGVGVGEPAPRSEERRVGK